jgi:diaminobutyrate-2-oxoglutarate transaminase
VFTDPAHTEAVCREAFAHGLVIETAGPRGEVVKVLPPLVIERAQLDRGLDILERAVATVAATVEPTAGDASQELYA